MTRVAFLKQKYKEFEKLKVIKALVEYETDLKIEHLRSDNGGEFSLDEFNQFSEIDGIKIHFSALRTPQQNGVIERKIRIVQEVVRTMLDGAKISYIY